MASDRLVAFIHPDAYQGSFAEVALHFDAKTRDLGMRPISRNVIIVTWNDRWGCTMGSL